MRHEPGRVEMPRALRPPAPAPRTKDTRFAIRSLGVLVGAFGVATLLGGCGASAVPDAPAESGTTPVSSDSAATVAESRVSIPDTVSAQVFVVDNEPGGKEAGACETIPGAAPGAPALELPATFPAPSQSSENEVDENETDEDDEVDADDEQDGDHEADENESDEDEPDEAGD
jgi:hypothetical protein